MYSLLGGMYHGIGNHIKDKINLIRCETVRSTLALSEYENLRNNIINRGTVMHIVDVVIIFNIDYQLSFVVTRNYLS